MEKLNTTVTGVLFITIEALTLGFQNQVSEVSTKCWLIDSTFFSVPSPCGVRKVY